jgi:hypothetical protein
MAHPDAASHDAVTANSELLRQMSSCPPQNRSIPSKWMGFIFFPLPFSSREAITTHFPTFVMN